MCKKISVFARLSNTIQGMYEGKQKYIDSLNQYELLVIDDLGAERKSEFMKEMVLFRGRHIYKRKILEQNE